MRKDDHHARPLGRISMSLPQELLDDIDDFVTRKELPSRSHAIALILREYISSNTIEESDEIMFGIILLHYYNNMFELPRQLVELQYHHIDEVIGSFHVQLVRHQTMEVVFVQGPSSKLRQITDSLSKLRGVIYCRLQMVSAIIPPLHPMAPS